MKRFFFCSFRKPSIMTRLTGVIDVNTTSLEGRLGLTHKRPSYRPTGTHLSPRFVLAWRSTNRSTSLSSTSRPTLCTHWSLMGNTAPPHWVVTRGRRWLALRPLCRQTVTGKGSIHIARILKPESVSLQIMKMAAARVIPESGLVQEGILMTPTRVETWLSTHQIMATNSSKPWDISWWNDKERNELSNKRPWNRVGCDF